MYLASKTTIPAKAQKAIYSKIIYDEIRAMAPPGRFLKQDPKTKLWSDIGEKKALDKTRQALREGAPDMLKGMGGGGGGDESGDSGDDYSRSRSEALGSMHLWRSRDWFDRCRGVAASVTATANAAGEPRIQLHTRVQCAASATQDAVANECPMYESQYR
jgi:hypothetical protein